MESGVLPKDTETRRRVGQESNLRSSDQRLTPLPLHHGIRETHMNKCCLDLRIWSQFKRCIVVFKVKFCSKENFGLKMKLN